MDRRHHRRYYAGPRKRWQRNPFNFLLSNKRRPTIHCKICGQATAEGKTYCTEHIEHQSYVQRLHEEQRLIDQEVNQVRERGISAIPRDSKLVKSALTALDFEDGIFPKILAANSDIPEDVIGVYIRYLTESRLAEAVPTRRSMKVYLLDSPEPSPERNLASGDIAAEFGVTRASVSSWAKKGAPHSKIKGKLFFNLEEIRSWKDAHTTQVKKEFKSTRAKFRGKMNVKPFTEEFWPALEADYLSGMTVNQLIEAYPVGWKRLNRYLQTKKLSRAPLVRLKDFTESFWDELEEEYLAGEPIQNLMGKYGVDKARIHRYAEQKGITRERLTTKKTDFDEPYWDALVQDFLAGMSLPNLKKKYHSSGDVIERYLEEHGLPSFRERQEKQRGFSDPIWDDIKQDYLDGMAVNVLIEKYRVGKKRVLRFIEEEGLVREPRVRPPKAFDEPFWADLARDYVDGMPIPEILKKYQVGRARAYRFLEQEGLRKGNKLTRYFRY